MKNRGLLSRLLVGLLVVLFVGHSVSFSTPRTTPTRQQRGGVHQTANTVLLAAAPNDRVAVIDVFKEETKELVDGDEGSPPIIAAPPATNFAQRFPFLTNMGIATTKTAAADLLAQTVIAGTPLAEVDLQRSLLFCLFGAVYLGGFQYLYQVQIFKRLFDVDRFTQQSWQDKLQDTEGLQALAAQTVLDLTVLTIIYLPTFYIFKASVFSGSYDPSVWVGSGWDSYVTNFAKDEVDLIKVWLPADLVCFSVPLYLRLPVRHVVSFVWTAYLSFARGGH